MSLTKIFLRTEHEARDEITKGLVKRSYNEIEELLIILLLIILFILLI